MLPVIVTPIITVALIWSALALGISLYTLLLIKDMNRSLEDRLDGLDALLSKGRIDVAEHQRARTAMLTKYA